MNARETSHRSSRRAILKLLGALSATALLPGCGATGEAPLPPLTTAGNVSRVLIIGGGMAGLTAANALKNLGVDAVVLEARERIGGRLFTRDLGGIPVDFGASWIHNPTGNPMTAFAQSAGVAQSPVDPTRALLSIHLFQEESGNATAAEVVEAFGHYANFEQRTPQILQQLGPQASIRDAIEYYVARVAVTLLPEQRRLVTHVLRFIEETFDSGPWDRISLDQHVNAATESYAGSEFGDFPEGGYRRLVQAMASNSDIRLGHRATKISADSRGASVAVLRGDGSTATFTGSHVLVTLPLGVLKQADVVFEPALPERKQSAISRVGFGNFEKIAMRFDTVFWEQGLVPRSHFYFRSGSAAQPTEFPFFLDLQKTLNQPVLVGLTSAVFAQDFVGLGETAVQARVGAILREAYGSDTPEPTHVLTSSWGNDPFTRGAYSYLPLGATASDMDTLAEPHAERILFAGEATYPRRYGYSDGALSSGLREVNRLLGITTAVVKAGPVDPA